MEENYCGHLQNNRAFTEENNDHTYCTSNFVTIMYVYQRYKNLSKNVNRF